MDTTRFDTDPDFMAATERTTLAAVFTDRDAAHAAIHRLHDEGFRSTWLGLIRSDEAPGFSSTAGASADPGAAVDTTRVEADNWFARVFGEADESLHDALVRRGVSDADARAAGARELTPGSAIVTVDGENHPELALDILNNGGQVITRGTSAGGTNSYSYASARRDTTGAATSSGYDQYVDAASSATMDPRSTGTSPGVGTGIPARETAARDDRDVNADDLAMASADPELTTQGYGTYRGGKAIDEAARLRLREERLRIDTERRTRGEATVGKDVVSQTQEVDVPLIREELFIERRPVSGSAATTDAGAIGSDTEVIRVPLSEETVRVTKTPIVTEEVIVGKRQVEDTEHVSETTRREELVVHDVDAARGDRAGDAVGTSSSASNAERY